MNRYFILFSAWAVQALIALCWLALLPSDTVGGLSITRLLLLGMILGFAGISATLTFRARRRADFDLRPPQRDTLFFLSVIFVILAPLTIITLRALGQTTGFVYTAAAERLTPLATWLTLSGGEAALLLAWQRRAAFKPAKNIFLFALLFTLIAAALGTLADLLPVRRDGSWGSPATPLLEWQIVLALFSALLALLLPDSFPWRGQARPIDPWVPLLIYLFTCLLWLSQPIVPGFFATPPRAPNFEIYPFSDALIYAQYVQSALAGHGFLWPEVPTRPLYIAFLTWLHALAGQDYVRVIALQTLVLAIFPAILYLIGREIGGRPLGVGLALLAILRDLTANMAAPFALNYTYSKLFFSEIPAALLIGLYTLLAMRWMRTPHLARRTCFIGGVLGLAALVRLQSAVLLIPVIIVGFFAIKNRRAWARAAALITLGAAITFLPWLVRNYVATGGLVLDNPISQTMTLARRWSGDNGNALIPSLPGETTAQYSSRMSALALENLRRDPQRILGEALGHFFNNESKTLLVFPARDQLNNLAELIWPQHAFWQNVMPSALSIFYLFLFGLGLASAWRRVGLPGLLPLAISLVYNAWTALFLSSGDRFLVPVDWVSYLYLFLGLLTLVSVAFGMWEKATAWVFARDHAPAYGEAGPVSWRGLALTATFILLLGAILPLTEWAFPKVISLKGPSPASGQVALAGRAIYPRYYKANQGEPGTAKLGYGRSAQARLVFFLVGEESTLVIFPLEKSPRFFPNTANVAVLGKQQDGYLLAEHIQLEMDGLAAQYP